MNRPAVYSYLTRYPDWHARSGKLLPFQKSTHKVLPKIPDKPIPSSSSYPGCFLNELESARLALNELESDYKSEGKCLLKGRIESSFHTYTVCLLMYVPLPCRNHIYYAGKD